MCWFFAIITIRTSYARISQRDSRELRVFEADLSHHTNSVQQLQEPRAGKALLWSLGGSSWLQRTLQFSSQLSACIDYSQPQ